MVSTVNDDGTPHAVPVLSVWTRDRLWFGAAPSTRKARNLRARPSCVVTASVDGVDLVVGGNASIVEDPAVVQEVADAYGAAYGWSPSVRDGALWADGAPTAGPPPFAVHRVDHRRVHAFPTDDGFLPTRFLFADHLDHPLVERMS